MCRHLSRLPTWLTILSRRANGWYCSPRFYFIFSGPYHPGIWCLCKKPVQCAVLGQNWGRPQELGFCWVSNVLEFSTRSPLSHPVSCSNRRIKTKDQSNNAATMMLFHLGRREKERLTLSHGLHIKHHLIDRYYIRLALYDASVNKTAT